MLQKQKGFIPIIGILILLAGLAASLYLVKNPTIFRPKAADERTRIEFVDAAGNLITRTNTNQVKLKLNYVLPPESPLVSDNFQPSPPFYATFFYPWYGNASINNSWYHWNGLGHTPPDNWFSHFLP